MSTPRRENMLLEVGGLIVAAGLAFGAFIALCSLASVVKGVLLQ